MVLEAKAWSAMLLRSLTRLCATLLVLCSLVMTSTADTQSYSDMQEFEQHLAKVIDRAEDVTKVDYCVVCEGLISGVQKAVSSGYSEKQVTTLVSNIVCPLLNRTGALAPRVCRDIIATFGSELVTVFSRKVFNPLEVCQKFHACPVPKRVTRPSEKLPSELPSSEEEHISHTMYPSRSTFRFLQLADIHVDPLYTPGTTNNCGEPMCCRAEFGPAKNETDRCGYWGDDNETDTPQQLFEHMLRHIVRTEPDLEFLLWTGDNPPHDVWEESRESQITNNGHVVSIIAEHLKIPVYPAFGNHESYPIDQFPAPPDNFWLMDATADEWAQWLPESALETVRYGGYYSVQHRPGVRIVALNTMYCDILNFWNLLNDTDPAGQLQWLEDTFAYAKEMNERVYLFGHIPPGDNTCMPHYSEKYYALIDRFSDQVAGQFFGHTHDDHFEVFRGDQPDGSAKPISVAYIAPSVTPRDGLNPSYRVFTADEEDLTLLDYEQYHANIIEANAIGVPLWKKAYGAREEYDLEDLSASSWMELVAKMEKEEDSAYFDQFRLNFFSRGRAHPSECDKDCKKQYLCRLSSGTFDQFLQCNGKPYNFIDFLDYIVNKLC